MDVTITSVICPNCNKGEFRDIEGKTICEVCGSPLTDEVIQSELDKAWERHLAEAQLSDLVRRKVRMMKWTNEKIGKLQNLCNEGTSNKKIAEILGCTIGDVYARRSQLGITIDKCKGIKPNPEFEAALPMPKHGMHKDVKQAFKDLDDAFLVAMARNETSVEDAHVYAVFSQMVAGLRESLDSILRGE